MHERERWSTGLRVASSVDHGLCLLDIGLGGDHVAAAKGAARLQRLRRDGRKVRLQTHKRAYTRFQERHQVGGDFLCPAAGMRSCIAIEQNRNG